MKKKKGINHLSKNWKKIKTHLKAFSASGNQDELHRLRVQIKKASAMLIFFERTSGKHKLLKDFKPVKKLFKKAGYIRDAHINLQLSKQYTLKNDLVETGRQQIIEAGTINFHHNRRKYLKIIKNTYKRVKKKLPPISNKSIEKYYKNQLEQIAASLAMPNFTKNLHYNRKMIKHLMYNYNLAENALAGALPFNIHYLDKLQESIGKWHDNVIATELFLSPEFNNKPVVTKIKKINAGVKRNITSLSNDFMKKATTVEHI